VTGWDVVEPVLTLGLSVSSLVIASIALQESARSGEAQRMHGRLSVKPLLHTWLEDDAKSRRIVFLLKNNGIGPAIIKRIQFFPKEGVNKKEYRLGTLAHLFDSQIHRFFDRASYRALSLASSYALSAGDQLTLFVIDTKLELPENEAERLSAEIIKGLSCFVEYENIYGERFSSVDP
jgi:hypothetical protein